MAAIDRRVGTLEALLTKMGAARRLTEPHRSALQKQIDEEKAGLLALRAKIEAETDFEALRAEVRSIAEDYRVYLLLAPKIHLVITSDRILAAASLFDTLADKLEGKIDEARAAGRDVADAGDALASMRTHVAAARSAAQGVPDRVLPLKPSGFPENRTILQAAREALKRAREELRLARDDAKKIVAFLRGESPVPTRTGPAPTGRTPSPAPTTAAPRTPTPTP